MPYAELEVRHAARRLGDLASDIYVGPKATIEALRSQAAKASILHIATHGEFPDADVIDLHRILLTPGVADDGVVSAELLRELPLGGVLLLVLCVCDGALLRFGAGEELLASWPPHWAPARRTC